MMRVTLFMNGRGCGSLELIVDRTLLHDLEVAQFILNLFLQSVDGQQANEADKDLGRVNKDLENVFMDFGLNENPNDLDEDDNQEESTRVGPDSTIPNANPSFSLQDPK